MLPVVGRATLLLLLRDQSLLLLLQMAERDVVLWGCELSLIKHFTKKYCKNRLFRLIENPFNSIQFKRLCWSRDYRHKWVKM